MLIAEAPGVPCRYCSEPVVWAYSEQQRRRIPINRQIVPDGNAVQVLRAGHETPGIRVLSGEERLSRQGARYMTHMVGCRERAAAAAERAAKEAS